MMRCQQRLREHRASFVTSTPASVRKGRMKTILLWSCLLFTTISLADAGSDSMKGVASWYGEAHRGKPMANGAPFDPDRLTAASWFFPLGAKVRVSVLSQTNRTIIVTITDHGPARRLVAQGRVIDLARAAFEKMAPIERGLIEVSVEPVAD